MISTFAEVVRRELEAQKEAIQMAVNKGAASFDEYNRLVGELKGLERALRTIDETLAAYERDESQY